jgi:imidazolonepropionase-like amidohydrolase
LREEWARTAVPFDYTEDDFRQGKVELARQMEFIGRARRAGIKITAGTDVIMPYVVPGAGLHEELRLLVESGLTPMEALVAATGQAAELIGQQNILGTVEKGKLADMVVLDADPIQDIRNTQKIAQVIKSGRVLTGPG